jgi:hypothetical protein
LVSLEVFARAGLRVSAVEADPDALSKGLSILDRSLSKLASRGFHPGRVCGNRGQVTHDRRSRACLPRTS